MRKLIVPSIFLATAMLAVPASAQENPLPPEHSQSPSHSEEQCAVTFFQGASLQGMEKTFRGKGQVADLDKVKYRNGEDLDNDVGSVGTLSNTWVVLYEDEDFENPIYKIPPNTWKNVKDVESFRVACHVYDGHRGGPLK